MGEVKTAILLSCIEMKSAGLKKIVTLLSTPDSYYEKPSEVIVRETHMSYVFLAGDYAFKLKKPVQFSYLDLSSLKERKKILSRELSLNKILAPGYYLGLLPIVLTKNAKLVLGEHEGAIIEW